METLKYKIIRSEAQYDRYCKMLEKLLEKKSKAKSAHDEIELLTLLIEKWDAEHNTFQEADPIELLHSLMEDHHLKAQDLVEILGVSKSMVSEILNYKKGLSKEVIRKLAAHFRFSQEAFNRPYKLDSPVNPRLHDAAVMNTLKPSSRRHPKPVRARASRFF